MKMTEIEFRERYEAEKHIYAAWGKYIVEVISAAEIKNIKIKNILKLTPIPRIKNVENAIEKFFYRKKYTNFNQLTDKVGARFVVLLEKEIKIIEEFVNEHPQWEASKSQDFFSDRSRMPEIYGYQSTHFDLVCRQDIEYLDSNPEAEYNRILIPAGLSCEIQIRTLLQHAHSELTHDRIYKPKVEASQEVKRSSTQCMALVEVTSSIFTRVADIMDEAEKDYIILEDFLKDKLYKFIPEAGIFYNSRFNYDLIKWLEVAGDKPLQDFIPEIKSFLDKRQDLFQDIQHRFRNKLIFAQPAILTILFLLSEKKLYVDEQPDKYPIPHQEVEEIRSLI
jgi:putative GTP pyrophosphokinase